MNRSPLLAFLVLLSLAACRSADPLDGLSEKEVRAAKAHAQSICSMANKAESSLAETVVGMGDLATGFSQGRPERIVEAGNALARKRGCVAK